MLSSKPEIKPVTVVGDVGVPSAEKVRLKSSAEAMPAFRSAAMANSMMEVCHP